MDMTPRSWRVTDVGLGNRRYTMTGAPMVVAIALSLLPGAHMAELTDDLLPASDMIIPPYIDDDAADRWFCSTFATPYAEVLDHVCGLGSALADCLDTLVEDRPPAVAAASRLAYELRHGLVPSRPPWR